MRPTEDIPPQDSKKLPRFFWVAVVVIVVVGMVGVWFLMDVGRSLRSGVQGEWSETIVLMTLSCSVLRSSDQSAD